MHSVLYSKPLDSAMSMSGGPCSGNESAPPLLPWDLAEPILIHVALHLHSTLTTLDLAAAHAPNAHALTPTSCPTTAPIFAGRGWSRTLLHLFYTRLHPLSQRGGQCFTYGTTATTNRIDRLVFLQSVYGGKPWHSSPIVAEVLSERQVQAAVAGAFSKGHLQALDWLVHVHGSWRVLGMVNTPSAPTCPLIAATHDGKLRALEWWFRLARQAGIPARPAALPDANQSTTSNQLDRPRQGCGPLWQVSFEVIEAAIRSLSVPMDCLHWWIQDYLPHHHQGDPSHSEAADLMFSYVQYCIESNHPSRVSWWIDQDHQLFFHALELDFPRTPPDYLTINEQLLLDSLLTTQFSPPPDTNDTSRCCSFMYIIDSPHFRPRFKLDLGLALVNRANRHSAVLTWWITQSETPFHLPALTIDHLATTAHSEIDAFDALQTLAETCSLPLDETELAMDLASEKGFDLLCEWWATHRGAQVKYSHRALEQAVARGMALVVEFWLVSGLPLKWRGNILEWAGKYWIPEWQDEVRRLWREFGKDVEGTVPWKADTQESGGE